MPIRKQLISFITFTVVGSRGVDTTVSTTTISIQALINICVDI